MCGTGTFASSACLLKKDTLHRQECLCHTLRLAIIKGSVFDLQVFRLMGQTASYPRPAHPLGNRGEYHGVETALNYGDAVAEFAALRNGYGIFHLPWRAKISV